jgi:hypothetical protein
VCPGNLKGLHLEDLDLSGRIILKLIVKIAFVVGACGLD